MFLSGFVGMATFLACNASVKLPIFNQCRVYMRKLFYYSLFLSRGASKAKIGIALINCVINLCYQYFFFEIFFFQIFFPIFLFQHFYSKFFVQNFFSQMSQNLFLQYFFLRRSRFFILCVN